MNAQMPATRSHRQVDPAPPVQFVDQGDVARFEPGFQAQRHQEAWLLPGRDQPGDGGVAQMVVVVVRDQHGIDRWQFARRQR